MKVSLCTPKSNTWNLGTSFTADKPVNPRPSQINGNPSDIDTNAIKQDNNRLITYSILLGTGLLAGSGSLLYRRNPSYVLKHLKPTKLTDSLPGDIKLELAKGNKFKKFENFINNPDEKYLTGKGANSNVYNIPFLDKYVLKIIKPESKLDLSQQYVRLFPDDINLGQPVWQHRNNPRILLLKKIEGEPYSIKNWTSTLYNPAVKAPQNVTQAQADLYYKHISKVSKMDQSVFDELARQIKILDTTKKYEGDNLIGFKTDSINPNNLMVDFKNNTIHIIDYFAKDNTHHKNSYMDMVAIMTDFTLLPEYRDLLKPQQQKELVNIIKTIHNKALLAAQKHGVSTDKNDFLEFINEINRYDDFRPMSVKKQDRGEYIRLYPQRAEELLSIIN